MSDTQKLTIAEFKRWLEGVEEMQGPEWFPTQEQWKKIRAKFNQIDSLPIYDIALKAAQDAARMAGGGGYMPPPVYNAPVVIPGASSLDTANVPSPAPVVPAPQGPRMQTTMPPAGFTTPKTPDIDTSGGSYRSAFE